MLDFLGGRRPGAPGILEDGGRVHQRELVLDCVRSADGFFSQRVKPSPLVVVVGGVLSRLVWAELPLKGGVGVSPTEAIDIFHRGGVPTTCF